MRSQIRQRSSNRGLASCCFTVQNLDVTVWLHCSRHSLSGVMWFWKSQDRLEMWTIRLMQLSQNCPCCRGPHLSEPNPLFLGSSLLCFRLKWFPRPWVLTMLFIKEGKQIFERTHFQEVTQSLQNIPPIKSADSILNKHRQFCLVANCWLWYQFFFFFFAVDECFCHSSS